MTYYRRAGGGKAWGTSGSTGVKKADQSVGTATTAPIACSIDVQTRHLIERQRDAFRLRDMYSYFYFLEQHYPAAENIFVVFDNWPVHVHQSLKENRASLLTHLCPMAEFHGKSLFLFEKEAFESS